MENLPQKKWFRNSNYKLREQGHTKASATKECESLRQAGYYAIKVKTPTGKYAIYYR